MKIEKKLPRFNYTKLILAYTLSMQSLLHVFLIA